MRYSYHAKPPKLEAACSTDQSRPALASVYFDAERAELQASDSYIAARVPVEVGLGETTGFLPVEAVKASRKRDAGGMYCNGAAEVMPAYWNGDAEAPAVVSFPRPDAGQFPKLEQLWPTGEPAFTVGINAGFLKRLAEALGAEDTAVSLSFVSRKNDAGEPTGEPDPLRPIIVRPLRGTDSREAPFGGLERAEGLCMPIRCTDA